MDRSEKIVSRRVFERMFFSPPSFETVSAGPAVTRNMQVLSSVDAICLRGVLVLHHHKSNDRPSPTFRTFAQATPPYPNDLASSSVRSPHTSYYCAKLRSFGQSAV